jgi:serine phosphatase RsbU (regulator of sigma subunit)
MQISDVGDERLLRMMEELDNFRDIAKYLVPQPGERPVLDGFDIHGGTIPLSGDVGGDHIIYVDFKQRFDLPARIAEAEADDRREVVENLKRCQRMAGVALLDVSGHRTTDALLAAMLHQAFLLGAIYELEMFGHITKRLFEHLNTRFVQSSGAHKYVAMLYGEISEDARFRFLSAGQPFPAVFSNEHDRFMEVSPQLCVSFPPVGMMPSLNVIDRSTTSSLLGFKDHYEMNEWVLMGAGDILLLLTDGVTEHHHGQARFFPGRLEQVIRELKNQNAPAIFESVKADLLAFHPPADDMSIVVVKRR